MFIDESPTYFEETVLSTKTKFDERCPRCVGYQILNKDTGELIPASCNTYRCEHCGWRKKNRLAKALQAYFKQFKIIRFWTFTFQSKIFDLSDETNQLKIASECWRRFVNNLRRSKKLSKHQQKVQYVKVTELHKTGVPHFHVFFDRWIPRAIIQEIWEHSIRSKIDYKEKTGNSFVEGIKNAKAAAEYVCKYMMKTILEISASTKSRIWSKSSRTKIFPVKPFYSPWLFINSRSESLYSFSLRVSSQESSLIYPEYYLTADFENKYIANSS
jgi:hypothetical protein